MFESRKQDWVISFFRKKSLTIDGGAVQLLLDMVENDTESMKNACEKLSFYFKEGTRITEEDIENFLYHSKEENVFSLFAKMCKRDLEASLEVLSSIFLAKETHPVQLLSGLLWQFKNLLSLSVLLSRDTPQDQALLTSNIRGKKNRTTYLEGSRNYSMIELQQIISLTEEYDHRLRTVRAEMFVSIVEMFVYKCLAPL